MTKFEVRVGFACALSAALVLAAACGSFDAADAERSSSDAGGDAPDDGGGPTADGALFDGSVPDGSVPADAGGGGCVAPCIASMPEDVTSLGCTADPNFPVYVGLTTQIRRIDKTTFADSAFVSRAARHLAGNAPLYSTGDEVLRGNPPTVISVGVPGVARGVADTPSAIYWGQRTPDQVRRLPLSDAPDAGEVFVNLPDLSEGMTIRAQNLYVALPAQQKVVSFALDGGALQNEIATGEAAYALASTSQSLFWVAPGSSAVRYVRWNAPATILDLFVAPGRKVDGVCTDNAYVYFNVDREIHRVPVP